MHLVPTRRFLCVCVGVSGFLDQGPQNWASSPYLIAALSNPSTWTSLAYLDYIFPIENIYLGD